MTRRVSSAYLLDKIGNSPKKKDVNRLPKPQKDFKEVLSQIESGVKVSKHAEKRLMMRNVNLNSAQLERVGQAMDRAKAKGIKDALIMLDGNALIASISNKTIITAAKQDDLDSRIITNIDGAIVL